MKKKIYIININDEKEMIIKDLTNYIKLYKYDYKEHAFPEIVY